MFIGLSNAYVASLLYFLTSVSVDAVPTRQIIHKHSPLQVRDDQVPDVGVSAKVHSILLL